MQKRGADIFLEQVTDRLHESATIAKAQHSMKFSGKMNSIDQTNNYIEDNISILSDEPSNKNQGVKSELVGNPKFRIDFGAETNSCSPKWLGKKEQVGLVEIHPIVLT